MMSIKPSSWHTGSFHKGEILLSGNIYAGSGDKKMTTSHRLVCVFLRLPLSPFASYFFSGEETRLGEHRLDSLHAETIQKMPYRKLTRRVLQNLLHFFQTPLLSNLPTEDEGNKCILIQKLPTREKKMIEEMEKQSLKIDFNFISFRKVNTQGEIDRDLILMSSVTGGLKETLWATHIPKSRKKEALVEILGK